MTSQFFCFASAQPEEESEAKKNPVQAEESVEVSETPSSDSFLPSFIPNYLDRNYIEERRSQVAQRVINLSERLDSLFGDEKADDDRNSSTLRVSQRYLYRDGNIGSDSIEASLNLYLPNLKKAEKRFNDYWFPKNGQEESDIPEVAASNEPFWKQELSKWSINPESGIRVNIPLYYFARVRARRNFVTSSFSHSLANQVGWSNKEEWQQNASFTSDYAFSDDVLLRFSNDQFWDMTFEHFTTNHGPSVLQRISETSGISYDFRYGTEMEGWDFYTSRMVLSSTYRREMPIPWIYMSLTPEVVWERSSGFTPIYTFYLKLELIFAKDRKASEIL